MDVRRGLLLLGCALGLAACNRGGESGSLPAGAGTAGNDGTAVIAKVGNIEITQGYFDRRYHELPQGMQERFSGENWEQRFLGELIQETLAYQAALDAKVNRDPDVRDQLDVSTRQILTKGYYALEFERKVQPSEDAIADYYANHRDEYRMLGRALGYHIQCKEKDKIDSAFAALQGGLPFAQAVAKYSEDKDTRANGGLLGWFNRDGYVLGLGFSKEFTNAAFALEPKSYSRPLAVAGNWHIIMIAEKTPDEIQSLDKVRDKVVAVLRPELARQQYLQHLDTLADRYPVTRYGKFNEADPRTAEQLYRVAAEARNPYAKLGYYETLVKQYPKDEHADDALFMIGFLNSEEILDEAAAQVAFLRLMKEYPKSEFVDEAQWMMQNLGRREPMLMGSGPPPADPAGAQGRIESVREKK